jgi:hypothetical protein
MMHGEWCFILGPGSGARSIVRLVLENHPDAVCKCHSDVALSAYRLAAAMHCVDEPATVRVTREVASDDSVTIEHQLDPSGIVGINPKASVISTALASCRCVREAHGNPQVFGEASQSYTQTQDAWDIIDNMFPSAKVIKVFRDEAVVASERTKTFCSVRDVPDSGKRARWRFWREWALRHYEIMRGVSRGLSLHVDNMKRNPVLWVNIILNYLGLDAYSYEMERMVSYIEKFKSLDCPEAVWWT